MRMRAFYRVVSNKLCVRAYAGVVEVAVKREGKREATDDGGDDDRGGGDGGSRTKIESVKIEVELGQT